MPESPSPSAQDDHEDEGTDEMSETTMDLYRQWVPITTIDNDGEFSLDASSQQSASPWSEVLPKHHHTAGGTREIGPPSSILKLPTDRPPLEDDGQHDHCPTKTQVKFTGMSNLTAEGNPKLAPLSCTPVQHVTPVLPTSSSNPELTPMTFFTYHAQLTFGLPAPSDGVNIAKYFRR